MRSKKYTALSIAIMLFIFVQSALPADVSSMESGAVVEWLLRIFEGILKVDRETLVFVVRKGAHFTEYMILGASLVAAMGEWKQIGKGRLRRFAAACAVGAVYAVTDEIHQYFVPGRSCELRDMMIDCAGVITGAFLITLAADRLSKRALHEEKKPGAV